VWFVCLTVVLAQALPKVYNDQPEGRVGLQKTKHKAERADCGKRQEKCIATSDAVRSQVADFAPGYVRHYFGSSILVTVFDIARQANEYEQIIRAGSWCRSHRNPFSVLCA
jgi:hypothetical protein